MERKMCKKFNLEVKSTKSKQRQQTQSFLVQESSFAWCLNYLQLFLNAALNTFLPSSLPQDRLLRAAVNAVKPLFHTLSFQNTKELGGKFRNGSHKMALHRISCSSARFCAEGLCCFIHVLPSVVLFMQQDSNYTTEPPKAAGHGNIQGFFCLK